MGNRKVGGSNPPGDDTFFPFFKISCIVDVVNIDVLPKGPKVNKGGGNRPFPSSPGSLFQNEGRCSVFDMEIIYFILMQIKLIFTRKVVHLASF